MPLPDSLPKSSFSGSPLCICNRYSVIETIGIGSYGNVSRVRDLKSNCIRALKAINVPNLESSEHEAVKQESRLLSQLSHPHVVKFCDSLYENHCFYIIMEFCSNGTLDEYLCKAHEFSSWLSEAQIFCWLIQLADALAYIHSKKILHRDMKTKNIFLCPISEDEGKEDKHKWQDLKIGDFGISRTLVGSTDQASTCIGTPYYFSPEVFKQSGYNHKADMWSLGCILFEFCCLKHPFTPADNIMQLMHRVVNKEPSYDSWHGPQELKSVCQDLLQKTPKKRHSAPELLKLDIILNHLQTHPQRHNNCKCMTDPR